MTPGEIPALLQEQFDGLLAFGRAHRLDGVGQNVLGAWAMITVTKTENNGKEYTNIANINSVPKQIKNAGLPEAFNKLAIFSIDEPDMELFGTFSDGLKAKIMSSPEWQARQGEQYARGEQQSGASRQANTGSGFDDMDDDIPF